SRRSALEVNLVALEFLRLEERANQPIAHIRDGDFARRSLQTVLFIANRVLDVPHRNHACLLPAPLITGGIAERDASPTIRRDDVVMILVSELNPEVDGGLPSEALPINRIRMIRHRAVFRHKRLEPNAARGTTGLALAAVINGIRGRTLVARS